MDPPPSPSVQTTPSIEEDEWDTDGFVIPSLGIEDAIQSKTEAPKLDDSKPSLFKAREEDHIYLGPHGAPPSQLKQHELQSTGRNQKFKQKLKEADRRNSGSGRENKVENLKELVGGEKTYIRMLKSSPRDWLDPHCHETEFERRYP